MIKNAVSQSELKLDFELSYVGYSDVSSLSFFSVNGVSMESSWSVINCKSTPLKESQSKSVCQGSLVVVAAKAPIYVKVQPTRTVYQTREIAGKHYLVYGEIFIDLALNLKADSKVIYTLDTTKESNAEDIRRAGLAASLTLWSADPIDRQVRRLRRID